MSPRSLEELVTVESPAWPELSASFAQARNEVQVLPPDPTRRAVALERVQVSLNSSLGAMAYETAGVLVDHGWIRLLGGGGEGMDGLDGWNGLGDQPRLEGTDSHFIVGYDLTGGFFALDSRTGGQAAYFGPDTLEWEALDRGYTDLVAFLLGGDLAEFYPRRWRGWEAEAARVPFDRALSLIPPPCFRDGKDLSRVSRRPVPARQLWSFYQGLARTLAGAG